MFSLIDYYTENTVPESNSSPLLRNCLFARLQLAENAFLYQNKTNPITLKELKKFLKAVPQEEPPQSKALSVQKLVE